MTTLSKRVKEYILKRNGTTLTQLEGVVVSAGFSINELYQVLNTIHRDKSIRRSVQKGEVVYSKMPEPKAPGSHLSWVTKNYPWPDNFEMPFPEIDMSWLFLKPEQMMEYKAAAKNMPVHMLQKRRS